MDDSMVDGLLAQVERGKSAHDLESDTLDFKAEGRSIKDFVNEMAEDSVCFANARGGTIVIGVRDNPGGPDALEGVATLEAERLRISIHQLTTPSLLVSTRRLVRDGKAFLVVEVPEGVEVHSTTKGGYRQRWGTDCQPMAPNDVSRLADERRGHDWSAGPSGAVVADVDDRSLELARTLLATSGRDQRIALADRPTPELLARLGLIVEGDRLTRAGALLLVSDTDCAPSESVVYQHRRTGGGEADFSRRWSEPLLLAFVEVFEAIRARLNITPVNLTTGQQIAMEDYPEGAVREALANALIHRDYREKEPVHIVHSPETLTVTSPGPLVTGVTESNILSRGTKPRYPLLARTCNQVGLVEYLGLGVNRMFREMARTGRALPTLEGLRDAVRVSLEGGPPNVRVARLMAALPEELMEDTDTLLTLVTLRGRRTVTAKSLIPTLQKSPDDIEIVLRRMSAAPEALIEPSPATRARRHPSYHLTGRVLSALGSSVSYHTRTRDEVDRKVVEHVRDFDVINNAALQRMLDVDVYAARDILRDLVQRGVLVRTSIQTRGKAVRYGRGPRFPGGRQPSAPSSQDDEDGLF